MARSLATPYRVPSSLVVFCSLVPLYILIPAFFPPSTRHVPELPLDRAWPLVPFWAIVYGALYLFLILLPVFVVRQQELIRRTVYAYLLVWIAAYLCFFVLYPTAAPRPPVVTGEGFAVWGLRTLYAADPAYNCFPSLHVAHSFVSALAVFRVHRRLGAVAVVSAVLVAFSTLFTRQHYVLDVGAGTLLACAAYGVFLARYPRARIPEFDRRAATPLAALVAVIVGIGVIAAWLAYLMTGIAATAAPPPEADGRSAAHHAHAARVLGYSSRMAGIRLVCPGPSRAADAMIPDGLAAGASRTH